MSPKGRETAPTPTPQTARAPSRLSSADPRRLVARPAPRIHVDGVEFVPAWVLRLALLATGLVGVVLVTSDPAEQAIGAAAAVLAAALPASLGPAAIVGVLGLGVAMRLEPFAWQVFALIAVVHAVVRLGALCAMATGWRTHVDRALLRHEARVWLGVQACTQGLAFGVAVILGASGGTGVAGYKVIGLIAAGALAVLLLPHGGTAREPTTGLIYRERPFEDDTELGDDGLGPPGPGGMGVMPGGDSSRWG